jgi:PAS domain S-box-containing protein
MKKKKSAPNNDLGRKKTSITIDDSKEKFSMLFEYAPDAYSIHDMNGKILDLNRAFENLFGYKKSEVVGKSFSNLKILPKKVKQKTFSDTVGGILGKSVGSGEYALNKKNGQRIILETRSFPLEIKGKNLVLVIGRDITSRKKIEEELLKRKKEMENYLNLVGNIVVALDKNGKIILLNREGYLLLEYQEGDLIGKNWFDVAIPETEKEAVKNVFQNNITNDVSVAEYYENNILSKTGVLHLISWHNRALNDKKGEIIGTISSGEDVTQRKRMEKELEDSKTVLEIKVRARTHELRELAAVQEKIIQERTRELNKKIFEMERFNKLTMGREEKILELKEKIKELEKKINNNNPQIDIK